MSAAQRFLASCLLATAAVAVGGIATPALADIRVTDRAEAEVTHFNISSVSSRAVGDGRAFVLRIDFYDNLTWPTGHHQAEGAGMGIDSRGGKRPEFLLDISLHRGVLMCRLEPLHGQRKNEQLPLWTGPSRLSCRLPRVAVTPTRAIRWKAESYYGVALLGTDWSTDHAPNGSGWLPHL